MVKNKARCHMVQYEICLSNGSGRHFRLYHIMVKITKIKQGLIFNVVMQLLEPFVFQGYEVLTDNDYSSPTRSDDLLNIGIRDTGTLRAYHIGVSASVVALKLLWSGKWNAGQGTMYTRPTLYSYARKMFG